MADKKGKITEEQAAEALRALAEQTDDPEDMNPVVVEAQAPVPPDSPEASEPPAETAEAPVSDATAAPSDGDDVASLKKRLEERDAEIKRVADLHEQRWRALQERNSQNERILRDRFLRKSSVVDRALQTLKAARSEQGIPETEVDRVIREIETTMNPQSPSYVPPVAPVADQEDQAIVLNSFLNEKGMTTAESQEFGHWVQTEAASRMSAAEQAIATRDLDGFLRLAHLRWQEGVREGDKTRRKSDAVQAVQTVQRVQKESAKAASASPAAPRKHPTPPKTGEIDWKKMSESERHDMVSALLKQSVDQYR